MDFIIPNFMILLYIIIMCVQKSFFWLLIGLIVLSFIFLAKPVEAFLGFGGKILNAIPCANGLLLTIGLPRGGLFLWTPATRTFLWYQLKPGPWALGGYVPGGSCVCPYGNCELGAIPALGTIKMIGTSSF